MKTPAGLHRNLAIVGLVAALTLGACASSAAPPATSSPPPTGSPSASPPQPTPSDVAGGSGSAGDPGTGIDGPVEPPPGDPDLGSGQAAVVIPKPGQLNLRRLPAGQLEASVDGRRVLVKATWWSGVEPCNVLDSVVVDRSGSAFAITLVEGTSDPHAMCIEIAMQKATIVDLGELEPGTYTITSPGGDATPVTVTVS